VILFSIVMVKVLVTEFVQAVNGTFELQYVTLLTCCSTIQSVFC
jgi:hypothetical protein